MSVNFPADIREDARFAGLKLKDFGILIPAVVIAVLFLFIHPLPFIIRLILLILIPLCTYIWLVLEVGRHMKIRKIFGKEPEIRLAAENTKNIQEIVAVKSMDGAYFTTENQYIHTVISLSPGAWGTKTLTEREFAGFTWVQAVSRVLSRGLYMEVWVLNDLEIIRQEAARQHKQFESLPEELKSLGNTRLEAFEAMSSGGYSRVSSYYIRVSADPWGIEFNPKPKSKADRMEKARQLLSESVKEVISKISAANVACSVLSGESLRDVAARQLDPAQYRADDAVRASDWIRPTSEEMQYEQEKKSKEKATQKGKAVFRLPRLPQVWVLETSWLISFAYRIWRPLTRLMDGKTKNLQVVLALHSTDTEMPGVRGVSLVINDLYKAYEVINTTSMVYKREVDDLPGDVEQALKTGYAYVLVSNPDEWPDSDVRALKLRIQSVARRYASRVDFNLVEADGSVTTI